MNFNYVNFNWLVNCIFHDTGNQYYEKNRISLSDEDYFFRKSSNSLNIGSVSIYLMEIICSSFHLLPADCHYPARDQVYVCFITFKG